MNKYFFWEGGAEEGKDLILRGTCVLTFPNYTDTKP